MAVEVNNELVECFGIFAKDIQDKTYFIKNMMSLECYWCYAEQELSVGKVVNGVLILPSHPEEFPMLAFSDEVRGTDIQHTPFLN